MKLTTKMLLATLALVAVTPSLGHAQIRVTIEIGPEGAGELTNPGETEVVIGTPDQTPNADRPPAPTSTPPPWTAQPTLPPQYVPQSPYAPTQPHSVNPEAERLRLEIRSIRLGGSIAMIPIGFGISSWFGIAALASAPLCRDECGFSAGFGIVAAGALALGIAGIVRLRARKKRRGVLREQLRVIDGAVARW